MGGYPSVIVRVRDEREPLERALRSVRAQSLEAEIIVVDSGSRDGSLEVARAHADQVLQLVPEAFTFGGALNRGAAAASGAALVALSAHCHLPRPDWLARALAHLDSAEVAAAYGCLHGPDRAPLGGPFAQDAEHARRHPYYGLSNHASCLRAELWRELPFDENLTACEDKAWAWTVMDRGFRVMVDPALEVAKPHRQAAGTRALYARSSREAEALLRARVRRPISVRRAARAWWSELPQDGRRPALAHRINPHRIAECAGRWAGERRGAR